MVTCGLWRSSKWFRLLELKVVINVKCSVLHLSYHVLPYLRLLLRWGNTDLVENRFYIKGHWYKIINSFSKGWRRVSRNLSPILFQAALEKQPPRKCGGGYLQKKLDFYHTNFMLPFTSCFCQLWASRRKLSFPGILVRKKSSLIARW